MARQSRDLERVRSAFRSGAAETVAAFLGSAAVAGFALDASNDLAGYPLPGPVVAVTATLVAAGGAWLFRVRESKIESLLAAVLTFFLAYLGMAVVALAGSHAAGNGASGSPLVDAVALVAATAAFVVDLYRSPG